MRLNRQGIEAILGEVHSRAMFDFSNCSPIDHFAGRGNGSLSSGYFARAARHFVTSSGLLVAVYSWINRSRDSNSKCKVQAVTAKAGSIGLRVQKAILKLDDHHGFHPEMVELHKLFKDGGLAVIPNVGYPNPNRSHFRSTDIWETASPSDKILKSGWLGRYFDAACTGVVGDPLGVRIGEQPTLAFAADKLRAATFANPKMLENPASGPSATALGRIAEIETSGIPALDFVQRTGNQSLSLSKELQRAVKEVKPKVDYPPFALCQSLRLVAQMISAGLPTQVYYVTHGGFDTHAAQSQRHAYLLQEFSQAVGLFVADLKAQGQLDRVMGISFSEFGRRVAENKNAGTDHGAASVMFAFGGKVKPGLHGAPPNLNELDPFGDLVHKTDFRQVYASVVRDWLNADHEKVLLGKFEAFPLLRS